VPHCPGGVLHPVSPYRRGWDSVIMLLLVYCSVLVPLRIGFALEAEVPPHPTAVLLCLSIY
jgi:hypothetical protein